jgi:hypothetical protein
MMVRRMTKRWQPAAPIALSLLLSAVVVLWFRADYFRPYADSPQSSLGSSDLHNFAWASTAYTNPIDLLFVAKKLLLNGGSALYPHYTNGYPLLARAYFGIFGDGLIAARMLPISIVAIGALMFLSRLRRELRNPLVFLALPLLYLSPIGRDAANFEMLETAHFLILGLSALALYDSAFPRWAKVACIVLCVCIYQVSAAFIFAIIVAEYLRSRNRGGLIATMLALFAAALVVAGVFLHAGGSDELRRILLQRSGLDSTVYGFDESITFSELNRAFSSRVHQNMAPVLFFFSIVEIVLLIAQRRYLLPAVFLGFVGYSLVLRNFVGVHYFTFLPFIFFIIAALMSLAWRLASLVSGLAGRIVRRFPSTGRGDSGATSSRLVRAGVIVIVLGWLVVDIGPRTRMYGIDDNVRADFDAITAYVAGHDISRCSTFAVTGELTDERIVYFLLARHVNRGNGEHCEIALAPRL